MIELEDNEGNVLIVTAFFDTDGKDSEEFTAALNEQFEKWGRFTIVNSHNGEPANVTISDANTVKSTRNSWIDDFAAFSRDTRVDFTVEWIPYVNAYKHGFLCEIVDGYIVAMSNFTWGNRVHV